MTQLELEQLKAEYLRYSEPCPCPEGAFARLEADLGVAIPQDAKDVGTFYPGCLLGGIEHYEFDGKDNGYSIATKTLELRESVGLPKHLVVLAEPPESIILWDLDADRVIWCAAHSVDSVATGQPVSPPADVWAGYAAFFRFLLDEEADEQV